MTNTVYITVGNIGSGKSTYCRQLAEQGVIVVNHDSIVEMVHGGLQNKFDSTLSGFYSEVEWSTINYALNAGRDVAIDRTSVDKKTRSRWINLAKSRGANSVVVVFPWETPEIHAKRRFLHDPRGMSYEEWLVVARDKMQSKYQLPDLTEGMTKIIMVGQPLTERELLELAIQEEIEQKLGPTFIPSEYRRFRLAGKRPEQIDYDMCHVSR